ncbi:division/cell wall cluster transcriptional repressor MraZ [Anaerovorax odorimutans]|uniref:division/cell wall cluster transcriptional repressor MraZ n=1 Tax=Anaerovorax odorimutans TaxID=109327 RepID=UPI000427AEAF|nr:division/cell wall cluster transcriptional repressor MraZ [Anaerovorax odorimutans]
MLMGEYRNSIDVKSRLIVPSKFREELGYKCVLTKGLDNCLYIYPMEEWVKFQEKLSKLPVSDVKARAFVRYFYASAVECELDKQGRITIPQSLKKYANIEKELVTLGVLNKVEIWSKEEWENAEAGEKLEPTEFAEQMEIYGI